MKKFESLLKSEIKKINKAAQQTVITRCKIA